MSEMNIVERADALLERIERYERRRNAEHDLFAIRQALGEFSDLRDDLREMASRGQRLRKREVRLNPPDGQVGANLVEELANAVGQDLKGVRERAKVAQVVRQHVRTFESEVDAGTAAYVEAARGGIDEGLLGALEQGGFPDAAKKLRPALAVLQQAVVEPPSTDEQFDAVDEAAARVRDVMTSLEASEHAALVTLLRTLVSPGETVTLDDIESESLADLQRMGAARNFIVRLRAAR